MGSNSHIEWTDHTFNPWIGCTKVSDGCFHCYAEARDIRFNGGVHWGKGKPRRRTSESNWNLPVFWNKVALKCRYVCENCGTRYDDPDALGTPWKCECGGELSQRRPRVFCASLADWLDDEVPIEWLQDLLALIHATPNLDWLLLTKRPENFTPRLLQVLRSLPAPLDATLGKPPSFGIWLLAWLYNGEEVEQHSPDNVWIGTTVENQSMADERIAQLLKIPARVRFLSCEPLLGPVDLEHTLWNHVPGDIAYRFAERLDGKTLKMPPVFGIDWVICGGESGPEARPMRVEWARALRDQCQRSRIPFLFKQWGEWVYDAEVGLKNMRDSQHDIDERFSMVRVGKKAAGRQLDGREWNEFPCPR